MLARGKRRDLGRVAKSYVIDLERVIRMKVIEERVLERGYVALRIGDVITFAESTRNDEEISGFGVAEA